MSNDEGKVRHENSQPGRKPLAGIRVLSVEHVRAGPTTSLLFADNGAEVIKVEPPKTGELGRGVSMYDKQGKGVPFLLLSLSRNKKSITIDLKSSKGAALFKRLVAISDVVIENMSPAVMDKLGLGYTELSKVNPGIVFASVSGYGHLDKYQSPYWDRMAMDPLAQALSGVMYSTGRENDPPWLSSTTMADTIPGILASFGILAALWNRNQTGKGDYIDMSMFDAMVFLNNYRLICTAIAGSQISRRIPTSSPYGAYKAKDGYFAIAVVGESLWRRFCDLIGHTELIGHPELKDGAIRAINEEKILVPLIEDWAKDKTVAEVCELLRKGNVPGSPVNDEMALLNDPHLKARKMLVQIDSPMGKAVTVGNPIKFLSIPEDDPLPPPELGEHNGEIFGNLLGLSREELEDLQRESVI